MTLPSKLDLALKETLVTSTLPEPLPEPLPTRITPEDTAAIFKKIDDAMGKHSSAVNHPSHYNQGKIECIDAIEAATVGLTSMEAFDTGSAIKYLWRWKHKAEPIKDLEKAKWYIDDLIKRLKESK